LDEIKSALADDRRVFWSNQGYEVIRDTLGQYLIIWRRGERGEHCIGLTHRDGVTMNGKPNEFFTLESKQ
jgi:hypothetical protein